MLLFLAYVSRSSLTLFYPLNVVLATNFISGPFAPAKLSMKTLVKDRPNTAHTHTPGHLPWLHRLPLSITLCSRAMSQFPVLTVAACRADRTWLADKVSQDHMGFCWENSTWARLAGFPAPPLPAHEAPSRRCSVMGEEGEEPRKAPCPRVTPVGRRAGPEERGRILLPQGRGRA